MAKTHAADPQDITRDVANKFYITAKNDYSSELMVALLENWCKGHSGLLGLSRSGFHVHKALDITNEAEQNAAEDTIETFLKKIPHGEYAIVPIRINNRWVLSIITTDKRTKQKNLYYFDPLNRSTPELKGKLSDSNVHNINPQSSISSAQDSGTYCIAAMQQLKDLLKKSHTRTAKEISNIIKEQIQEKPREEHRLRDALKIAELAKSNPSMRISSGSVVAAFSPDAFRRLEYNMKRGDLRWVENYLNHYNFALKTELQENGSKLHKDAQNQLCVIENTTSNGKTFEIKSQSDYVIKVPVIDARGKVYSIGDQVQYDVLMFKGGKLLSYALYSDLPGNDALKSQLSKQWLADLTTNPDAKAPEYFAFDSENPETAAARQTTAPSAMRGSGSIGGKHADLLRRSRQHTVRGQERSATP
jgi:hypothetical protein